MRPIVRRRQLCAVLGGAALLGSLTACGGTQDQSCDGGSSPGAPDHAARTLLQAAADGSPELACQVVTEKADDATMNAALTDLKDRMDAADLDPETAEITAGEQGGSRLPVTVHVPGDPAASIRLDVLVLRDGGHRVMFPGAASDSTDGSGSADPDAATG